MPKLTKRVVEATRPREREHFLWDDELKGFGMRVLPSGRRSYVVQYRAGGRTRRMTLGAHGPLSPEVARGKAMRILARVIEGADPSADRWASIVTVRELATRYLEEHASTKKKPSSAQTDARNLRLHILPSLGDLPVGNLSHADVAALHHRMRETPGAANRVHALLSKMMNLAEHWGLRPGGANPCRHVQRYPERKLERFLSMEEIRRLGHTLSELENSREEPLPAIGAIRLLILTGARRGEILRLRWEDVDFERDLLRIQDSKTGPKWVPLSGPALQLLRGFPRTSEWLFPTAEGTAPVSLSKPWGRIRKRAGLGDVRLHDLRHSFASVGAGSGVGLPIVGRLLGHRHASTTNRYVHFADDPLRQAAEAIAGRIAEALGDAQPGRVASLGAERLRRARTS